MTFDTSCCVVCFITITFSNRLISFNAIVQFSRRFTQTTFDELHMFTDLAQYQGIMLTCTFFTKEVLKNLPEFSFRSRADSDVCV